MKKYLLTGLPILISIAICASVDAWDGFDADTSDLVEIIPDRVPGAGDTVDVRNYENGSSQTCLVESVTRNRRTIEVAVRFPGGEKRTLVMESR